MLTQKNVFFLLYITASSKIQLQFMCWLHTAERKHFLVAITNKRSLLIACLFCV